MKTILHIDDDKFLLKMYGDVFREWGYNVISTKTLDEDFVSQIAKLNPDLIISDVVKPKPNGLDIIEAVKSDSRTKDIPFVFLSNSIDEEVKEVSKKYCVHEPILKATHTPTEIADMISRIIEESQ